VRVPVLLMKLQEGAIVPAVSLLFRNLRCLGSVGRSWEQRSRTGSSVFRSSSGRLGSAEWFAGAGFVVAWQPRSARPLLQLVGLRVSWSAFCTLPDHNTGIVISALGMRDRLRAGLMATRGASSCGSIETTTLVPPVCSLGAQSDSYRDDDSVSERVLVTPNLVALAGFVLLAVNG